ncbi:Retroviral aspartyl protease [Candidatus Bathyarchaeota archaeon]|nr:Retroviral aspartyl protease [Candidatus Bathyarchaeota archaeon]
MGFVRVKAKVWNVENLENSMEVTLLADTGAIYTVLPESLLKSLGVKSIGRRRFRLANNQILEKEIGIIGIEVNGLKTHTIAVFGDENVYLLGVVTLEELGLEVDPVKGGLKPLELLLM